MHRLYGLQAHKPLELDIRTIISTNLSSPRFSQLPFWPAGFLTSLLVIENITDIFFPIWTLWGRCEVHLFIAVVPFVHREVFTNRIL